MGHGGRGRPGWCLGCSRLLWGQWEVEAVLGEEPWGALVQSRVVGERKTTPVGHVFRFEDEVVKGAEAGVLPQVIPASREALTKTTSA